MFVRTLTNQLIRDLKASWPKTAVLGLLLLVGIYFWIPPLYRAVVGVVSSGPEQTGRGAARTAETAAPVESAVSFREDAEPSSEPAEASYREADEILQTDPLVRSAEVSAIESDPFRIDRDQFSPPILFAEDPPEKADADDAEEADAETAPLEDLVLKSTLMGASRRAALINRKLYREGTDIHVNGEAYRLERVHPRKVVLRRGEERFELKIVDRPSSGTIELERQ